MLLRSRAAAKLIRHSTPFVQHRLHVIVCRPEVTRGIIAHAAAQPDGEEQQQQQQDDDFMGLLPDEDPEVPGTYMDAMNSNTKLGKAVRAAVEELEHLGDLENDVLQQCDDLLKKLGMKGSIFGSTPPPQQQQQQQQRNGTGASS